MDRGAREAGTPTPVVGTTSGQGTMGAGTPLALVGIWVGGALTAQVVQLWTGTAGNTTTGQIVAGTMTLAANAFYRLPGYFSKGLTYYISNENTNLTFFWNPA